VRGDAPASRKPIAMEDEILYEAHPPMFRNNPVGFVLSVALIAAAVGILILLVWYVKTRSEKLTITREDLRYERGILSKSRSEVRLTGIRSVRVHQSLFQRMFGTGDIEIYTAGDRPEIIVKGIPDPNEVREIISNNS
jgi:uncharacterized membrane protein YdbT with pleckstrin-like domain